MDIACRNPHPSPQKIFNFDIVCRTLSWTLSKEPEARPPCVQKNINLDIVCATLGQTLSMVPKAAHCLQYPPLPQKIFNLDIFRVGHNLRDALLYYRCARRAAGSPLESGLSQLICTGMGSTVAQGALRRFPRNVCLS